ncbi:MAG: metallophosphoesterase family protein, partial [Terriglobales bacterium]
MARKNLLDLKASGFIEHDHNNDGIDRRGFLKCMAWAGAGTLLVLDGGIVKSFALSGLDKHSAHDLKGQLSFVQISDSHIGFNKAANTDVVSTLRAAIDMINALPTPPAFILHTGDVTHLSRETEFDTLEQNLRDIKTERIFYVPGEHD